MEQDIGTMRRFLHNYLNKNRIPWKKNEGSQDLVTRLWTFTINGNDEYFTGVGLQKAIAFENAAADALQYLGVQPPA
ncbi:hypothetical protein FRC01_008837 [Tulasnella sp. 417]|nr:hypothetical protein FRC01_008837 [Tulasnella sp. 417]